uniref:14_3_3 domain-containing protein n=1 Tax=Globodera pallida TaxID=36090 RepID=A0A183BLE3_GLOPA
MEIEKDKAKNKKEIAKFDKAICSKLCKIIEKDVDKSVLELIREAYQNLEIMQILATPEKQKEYVEHFQMYYYKKEDLEKQLSHAKDEAAEMPEPCAATEKAYKAAACCCKSIEVQLQWQ